MKSKKLISLILTVAVINSFIKPVTAKPLNEYSKEEIIQTKKVSESINESQNLLLSYEINKQFNGTSDLVDVSNDIDSVKSLNEGAILIDFHSESSVQNQVLFSMTDSSDAQSHLYVKLLSGNLRYEVREGGQLKSAYTVKGIALNDGNSHKILINTGSRGLEIYIDGVRVAAVNGYDQFFNDVNTPDTMTIGAIKNSSNVNGAEFFNGVIAKVDVYGSELDYSKCIELTGNIVNPEKPEDYDRLIELINSQREVNMVFTGDSITHGPLHTKGYRSYSEHFNERIRGEEVNGNIKSENFIINTGVSSGKSTDILNNFDKVIATHNPEVVFVMIGMNDCNGMSLEEYESNIKEIVRKIREIGAIPVLQTSNTAISRPNLTIFMQKIREVANEAEVVLIDHYRYWEEAEINNSNLKKEWLNDSIHPNEEGHLQMAKLIFRELGLATEGSFTNNLTYPLTTAGKFVNTSAVYPYPEYVGIEGVTPILNYKVDKEFYKTNYIDKTEDISKVENLEEGSIVARFNLTNGGLAQTLISLSDGNDPSSNVTLAINSGKIHYEVRESGDIVNVTSSSGGYNDGKWHTVVLNASNSGTKIYIDGELILTDDRNGFFADMNTPNNFNIGRNVHNTGGEWYYNGAISYVDVYSDVLTEEQAIAVSSENPKEETEAINLENIKAEISSNTDGAWVFLGDEDTASKGDTYGYKNFVEYFEERVRWDLNGGSMIKRRKFMINSGVDGISSTEILANFDSWASGYKPSVVSVMVGGREAVSVEEFEANLREIVTKIEAIGAIPFLQTPVIKNEDISDYISVIRKVADEEGVALIDHYSYWSDIEIEQPQVNESWLTANGEPNHRGHLEIAKKMLVDLGIAGGTVSNFNIPYTDTSAEALKTELQILVNEATQLYDNSEEGDAPGQYPVASKLELKLSIDFANVELERENSTLNIVEGRIKELKKAIEVFKSLVNENIIYRDGDFNQDGKVNIADLAIASKNHGKNSSDSDWSTVRVYDINEDNVINEYEINFIMDKILNN